MSTPPPLQLTSPTHNTTALLQRTQEALQSASHNPAHAAPQPAAPLHAPKRQGAIARWWALWAEHHHSWYWLVMQIPGLRDVYRLARALLTIQGALHRLHLALAAQDLRHAQAAQELAQQAARQQRSLLAAQDQIDTQAQKIASLRKHLDHTQQTLHQLQTTLVALNAVSSIQGEGALAQWYTRFEADHRGDQQTIAQRQQAYLPAVLPVLQQSPAPRALDLGCGRAEWAALLAQQGYPSEGVDSNAAMQAMAQPDSPGGAQPTLHTADLFAFLAQAPAQHYTVVTAFQVAEHLPFSMLYQLVEQAWRVLQPGGLLVLETPNPENLQVAAYSFWSDPTHNRPLPPALLLHMAKALGFEHCHIERSNPWPPQAAPQQLPPMVHKLLFGPQDYALLARKPHTSPDTIAHSTPAP